MKKIKRLLFSLSRAAQFASAIWQKLIMGSFNPQSIKMASVVA